MTIQIIDRLYDSGELRSLVQSGIICPSILEHRKIYHAYYSHLKESKLPKSKVVADVGKVFNTSSRNVYKILNKLNYTPPK